MLRKIEPLKLIATSLVLVPLLVSCGGQSTDDEEADSDSADTSTDEYIISDDHDEESDYEWEEGDEVQVTLNGDSISVIGEGAEAEDSTLTISKAGVYRLSGTLYDGAIVVDADGEVVQLILDGVDIYNSSSAPVFVQNAEKTILILEEESENVLSDSSYYQYDSEDEDEPNATLFSKDSLTISGLGSLTIDANYNDAITSKDGMVISGGNITLESVDDGIRGKDYLIIEEATLNLTTDGDGLKSDNEDEDFGYIIIYSGTINIDAGADGIQANSNIQISDGAFDITTANGSATNLSSDETAKALKSSVNIFIEGGEFTLNSADDAIHSNNGITIYDGSFVIESGDDGIHADTELTVDGGDIVVSESYEGLESGIININEGQLNITASDDGVNVAGGVDGSGIGGGGPGYNVNTGYLIDINDGYLVVDAGGDGLDANGDIEMSGGTVIINGPTSNGDGALDYDGSFEISGGFLLAVGSEGMAQGPNSSSSQEWLELRYGTTLSAGSLIHLESGSGESMFTFSPSKMNQSMVFSSPDLEEGVRYNFYAGGSSTGSSKDGLYEDGTYSGGRLLYTFD
jgi:hypothetical protein